MKKITQVFMDIRCDGCGCTYHAQEENERHCEMAAIHRGWITWKGGRDFCPGCVQVVRDTLEVTA